MSRYFIHMAYDGTAYHGWQVQPNGITIQEVMEKALSTVLREAISVTGAGRTDTGVHASRFVAHFDLGEEENEKKLKDETIPKDKPSHIGDKRLKDLNSPDESRFLFKLNRFLPEDVVVYSIQKVRQDLHARFSAKSRTYHYHISTVKPLFTRNYAHYNYGTLDVAAIEKCCKIILKTTDFTSFSKLHTDVKTNNCHVSVARWKKVEGGYLFEITADRFLRNMVRSLAGTLVDVGKGKLDSKGFQSIVDAKDRGKAGQSAPARGLFLVDIAYDDFSY